MGPFQASSQLEVVALLVIVGIGVAFWLFTMGRRSAATGNSPELVKEFRRECPDCGSSYELRGTLTIAQAEASFEKWFGQHVCFKSDLPSRDTQTPTKPSATG